MKRYIFVDTSAWIALADKSDQNHHRAQTNYEQQIKPHSIQLLTSDYVLDETLTLIRYHMGLIYARTFWQSVQQAQDHGSLSISRVTEEVWLDALALFFSLPRPAVLFHRLYKLRLACSGTSRCCVFI